MLHADTEHNIRFLSELSEEINTQFSVLLESASNRVTKLVELDKQAWNYLDDEEVACKQQIADVENVCEEQVHRLRYFVGRPHTVLVIHELYLVDCKL